jgi:hypothetical protein
VIPLVCPRCWSVAVVDTPPKLGEPIMCPCLDRRPISSPVALVRLRLPEGYELARIVAPPATATIEHVQV